MVNTVDSIKEAAERTARESILKYLLTRKVDHEPHILLTKIFPVEAQMKSGLHGLTTSLGSSLWEKLAKEIALKNGFNLIIDMDVEEIDHSKSQNFPDSLKIVMQQWNASRPIDDSNPEGKPLKEFVSEYESELNKISNFPPIDFQPMGDGQGIDVFLEKDQIEYAFDLKTVQPTKSSGKNYYSRLLNWYQFRILQKKFQPKIAPQKEKGFQGHFVIPYDTTQRGWWNQNVSKARPLSKFDLLVADDFWDLLSGITNTLQSIEAGFDNLASDQILVQLYRDCINDDSEFPRLKLLEYERNLAPLEEFDFSTKAAKEFECSICKNKFKQKLEFILSPDYSCSKH